MNIDIPPFATKIIAGGIAGGLETLATVSLFNLYPRFNYEWGGWEVFLGISEYEP